MRHTWCPPCLNYAFQVEESDRKKREEEEQRRAEEERKRRDEIRRQQMELQWQKEEEVRQPQPLHILNINSFYTIQSRNVKSWRRSKRDNKFWLKWKKEERLKRKLEGGLMNSRSAWYKQTHFVYVTCKGVKLQGTFQLSACYGGGEQAV